jgi:hypothetical protein
MNSKMKYIVSVFILFLVLDIHAQTDPFEGIMTWSVTVQTLDEKKAQFSQRETQREDYSEINEAILELEQQLKDPEMQEMLLENPTIKNSMQKRLQELKNTQTSNLEGANNSIFPTSLTMYFKNKNSYTRIDGGSMAKLTGNIMYLNNSRKTYFIKDGTNTYSVINDSTVVNKNDIFVSLIKTTDTTLVLNYKCVKYILTKNENNEVKTSFIWITKDIPNMNPAAFRALGFSNGNLHHEAFKQMDGIPLRIELNEYGYKMTLEVTDLSKRLLPDSYFIVPQEYQESAFGY